MGLWGKEIYEGDLKVRSRGETGDFCTPRPRQPDGTQEEPGAAGGDYKNERLYSKIRTVSR